MADRFDKKERTQAINRLKKAADILAPAGANLCKRENLLMWNKLWRAIDKIDSLRWELEKGK